MSKQAQEIPQGQPQEVMGGGLTSGAVKQLIAREELVSTAIKDNTQLLFFNANGAWARIVSSVNTLTKQETLDLATGKKTIKEVTGNKNLAYNNVIMGGTLKQSTPSQPTSMGGGVNENLHNPINIDNEGYITAGDINNNAYNKYNSLGFRPTPGINSVSVTSKGTYGTLREAEVQVTVWTLEDLEMMQALYLRPGFTILLEWGHSLQLDSETKTIRKEIDFYRKFLTDKLNAQTIEKDLLDIVQNSDFNYDSMFGYVSNFSWSFRNDGGYDCSIKIISKGSILESLAVTFDPSNVYPSKQFTKWSEDKKKKEKQSIFHKLFAEIDKLRGIFNVFTNENFRTTTGAHFKEHLNSFLAFKLPNLEFKDTGWIDNDDVNEYWVPLYVVLDVYNNYISTLDATQEPQKGSKTRGRKLTQFYTGFQDTDPSATLYNKKTKYLTNEFHFSIDPVVCILPKKPASTKLVDTEKNILKWPDGSDTYPMGVISKNNFHKNVENAFKTKKLRGEPDDILNILLSVEFLQAELGKIVDASKDSDQNEGNDMVSFLRTILQAMNEAMGGINDLDVFYDEKDDLFYIVDRKVTPTLRQFIPTLSLTGLRSSISNLSIDSKISSNIGNMVSIAAQGSGGHTRDNIAPLLEWNRGLLDRHITHKSQKNTVGNEQITEKRDTPETERLKQWIEDYYDFWEEFNGKNYADNGDYDREALNNIKNYHKEFCQKWVVEKRIFKKEDPIPAPGVIPIELSFTIMGIAGLKIGQTFRIEEGLLPQSYSEKFGFIITGLSHSISNNNWTTDIKTQFYSIKPPSLEEIAAFEERYGANTEQYKPSTDTGGNSGPNIESTNPPIEGAKVNYDTVKASVVAKGYRWDDRDWAVNIVGIRNYNNFKNGKLPLTNKFDDIMTISWKENGVKKSEKFACTTDPGKYWLVESTNSAGTAILKEGQYINSHRFGTHKANPPGYVALVQANPVTVWRDRNGDSFYDFTNPQTGIFGINIHRASPSIRSGQITKWSAGCQVVDLDSSLQRILQVAKQASTKAGQKLFTYTLLNSNDLKV